MSTIAKVVDVDSLPNQQRLSTRFSRGPLCTLMSAPAINRSRRAKDLGAKQPEPAGNGSSALSSACVQPRQEFLCALPLPGQRITLDDSQDRIPRTAVAGFSHLKRHCVTSLVM
jgi:hypothetical protein